MPTLPPRPDLAQLRRRATDLLRAAKGGDAAALARITAVSDRVVLASAQLALARELGFASWARLKTEIDRRDLLDDGDAAGLAALLAEQPDLATTELTRWRDHPLGASPLNYVAMLRFDTARQCWRDVPAAAALARTLLAAGAPVDGPPGTPETPLATAASYGDAAVAQVLVEAGADLEARAADDTGGVPGGTPLLHAAVFGMTAVVDVLVRAGAQVPDLVQAAATGDLRGFDPHRATPTDRLLALLAAAHHQRLEVLDLLVAAGTPVDEADPIWGRHPLRLAAEDGRPQAVRRLLELGADPARRDGQGRTPLDLCRAGRLLHPDDPAFDQVEALLTAAHRG